jgi:uncharacterized YigZ family protein
MWTISRPVLIFCAARPLVALGRRRDRSMMMPYDHRPTTAAYLFSRPTMINRRTKSSSSMIILHSSSGKTSPFSTSMQINKTLDGKELYAAEEIVKKSRFMGYATHCTSWEEAQTILDGVKTDHPKSRHVCFGYISGDTERSSDDGEPSGTAGAPILNAIKGENLSDTLCIVVRYFGGVKLGAGGLIRAYGNAARLVLRSARTTVRIPRVSMRILTSASNLGAVYAASTRHDGVTMSDEAYNDCGELEVTITCNEDDGQRLMDEIVDATRGGVIVI